MLEHVIAQFRAVVQIDLPANGDNGGIALVPGRCDQVDCFLVAHGPPSLTGRINHTHLSRCRKKLDPEFVTKSQSPNPKSQSMTNVQSPMTDEAPFPRDSIGSWNLGFYWDLGFGHWSFFSTVFG